jgi:site-specific recombinase XerD
MMTQLFEHFIREKTYIQGRAADTIANYKDSLKAYRSVISGDDLPTKQSLDEFVIGVRQRGMSVGCANAYFRAFNVFLGWLHTNEYTPTKLRIAPLKQERVILRSFTDAELRTLLAFRPRKLFGQQRLYAMVCFLIDTGARVDEALSLKRDDVDLVCLVAKVRGKGNKERIVPLSLELRKVLVKWLDWHSFDLAFPTRDGRKWQYMNACREFQQHCERLQIDPAGFHCLRRTFARNYLRQGGNLIYLQATMGHTRLETTRVYVEVETEALKETHFRTSILSRLR